jgi:hypothetical protein
MITLPPPEAAVEELSDLAAACDEGRRRFQAAASAADDILARAIYLHKSHRCASMRDELEARGGRHAAHLPEEEESPRAAARTHKVRCLNWQSAAALRYELALHRRALSEDVKFLLARHLRWLEETVQHVRPLPDAPLSA